MSRVNCDVVVIGTELSGLFAAALIAHTGGKRVIVIEDKDPEDALPLGDRLAPTATTLSRFPTSEAALAVIDALGLKQDARRVFGEPHPVAVIDDPETRLFLSPDAVARSKEFNRVFGDAGAGYDKALAQVSLDGRNGFLAEAAHVHEDGFFEKRRHKARVAALGSHVAPDAPDALVRALLETPIGVVLDTLLPYVSADVNADRAGQGGALAALHLAGSGYLLAKGGLGARAALKAELERQVIGHGGEVIRERVENLAQDGNKVNLLRVAGANEYVARVVIDATSKRDVPERLLPTSRKEKLIAQQAAIPTVGDAVSVRWLVPLSLLPRGMPPLSLVLSDKGAPATLVGIFTGAPLKAGHRGGGFDDTAVAVVATTACAEGQSDAALAATEARLQALLPFVDKQVRIKDTVSGLAVRCAVPRYARSAEHALIGRRPQTPFANLLRAGRDLVPALSLEGEIVAARSVATAAQVLLGQGK